MHAIASEQFVKVDCDCQSCDGEEKQAQREWEEKSCLRLAHPMITSQTSHSHLLTPFSFTCCATRTFAQGTNSCY
jgi:hypothetical protein